MQDRSLSFRYKIIILFAVAFIPLLVLMTLFFIDANKELQTKTLEEMVYNVKEVESKVDDTVLNVYGVSDAFAYEPRLLEYLNRSYEGKDMVKRQSVVSILRKIFDGYDLLKKNEKIAAIYTYKNELFNFQDPNMDDQDIIDQLLDMNIDDPKRLGQFYWYPLMPHFLTDMPYGDIRKDQVIYGSRRVFSLIKSQYAYIHIFALKEEDLFLKYQNIAKQMNGEIYILNKEGGLLSSSDMTALKNGRVDPGLVAKIKEDNSKNITKKVVIDGKPSYLAYSQSQVSDWFSVLLVPQKKVLSTNNGLYINMILILSVSLVFYGSIILYLYFGFMNPIGKLIDSMKLVYYGDLENEVSVDGQQEVKEMLTYYNAMIKSIKTNIKERLETEKEKQELEYEVLMSQVNPHFLYNTLESIVWMATEANRPDIRRLAASLGRLYRLSVGDGEEYVTLNKEIEHVTAYCNIQKNRYQDKVTYYFDSEAIHSHRLYTIKMILQPVVENTFIHGLDGAEGPVQINIRVKVFLTHVTFYISDSGQGMSQEQVVKIRGELAKSKPKKNYNSRTTGIGLASVSHRLRLHFGLEGKLNIYSKKGKGTLVIIKIPKIDNKGQV